MKKMSRREASAWFVALGGMALAGCGSDDGGKTTADSGGGTDTGSPAADAAIDAAPDAASATSWATGGTKSMTAKATYPDPFAGATSACALYAAVTEGPCTEAEDQVREDVSEGYGGLPVRLVLRAVSREGDASCVGIAGAKVKIWHTQLTGSYSGDTPNPGMCLKDSADSAKHYFRGVQTTDTDGRVGFDTCFPGWYRGRAIHIHFTITIGDKSFTSQLVFEQTLVDEIFSKHPEYAPFGLPDTTNASDNVVKDNVAAFTLTAARMSDGAMLASKEIVVS
jgi:protocatechuate 3,4-dioxygenase beta subunit